MLVIHMFQHLNLITLFIKNIVYQVHYKIQQPQNFKHHSVLSFAKLLPTIQTLLWIFYANKSIRSAKQTQNRANKRNLVASNGVYYCLPLRTEQFPLLHFEYFFSFVRHCYIINDEMLVDTTALSENLCKWVLRVYSQHLNNLYI